LSGRFFEGFAVAMRVDEKGWLAIDVRSFAATVAGLCARARTIPARSA
jgi:hypothetical protein